MNLRAVSKILARKKNAAALAENVAVLIDLSGALADIPTEDEDEAAAADWQHVGDDLRSAAKQTAEAVEDAEQRQLLLEELVEA